MLAVHPADAASIFDANRARGRIALAAQCSGGRTRIAQLREEGSLRVRFPAHVWHGGDPIGGTCRSE